MKKILLAIVLATGCYGGVMVETPDLVVAAPGVRVIANYDESIFFADGFYWWFYGDAWYRSTTYTGGWVYWSTPPSSIVRIDRPHAYRYYRPQGYVPHRRPAPAHTIRRPVVRDHRARR